jgi:flagellar biosynthetic protein FliR
MLADLLVSEIFAFLLVFCRLGAAIMLLPGFGEAYVPGRFRLFLAGAFSIILAPVLTLPIVPDTVFALLSLMLAETLVGLFIGGLSRILISTVSVAGTIISIQSNLASLLTVDVTQIQGQTAALSNFMGIAAVVILFSMNLHHLMLRGVVDSYSLFLPGVFPNVGDFADHASHTLNSAFIMAVKMSAPFIIISTILNLGVGLLARLVPTIQGFFVMTAPAILINFFLFMVTFSSMMYWYMEYFKETLAAFLTP